MGVMEARRRILLNQPHLIDASGNPIAFQTDMVAKMGVKAHFSPVQEGTGDPSPSNVRPISGWTGCEVTRTGKNLFDKTKAEIDKYIDGSGSIKSSIYGQAITDWISVVAGEKIIANNGTNNNYYSAFYSAKDTSAFISSITGAYYPFTVPAGAKYIRLTFPKSALDTYQVELGSAVTAYEPYSGAKYPVTFPAVGKNLFDVDSLMPGTIDGYGNYSANNNRRITPYLFLKAGTYTVSKEDDGEYWKCVKYTLDDKSPSGFEFNNAVNVHSFTLSQDYYIRIAFDNIPTDADKIQLESGSTATSYEPFTNTIYGGYVDLERGEVVATHAYAYCDANNYSAWTYTNLGLQNAFITALIADLGLRQSKPIDQFVPFNYLKASNLANDAWSGIVSRLNGVTVRIPITVISNIEEWKNYIALNPLEFVYELATPVHYPLTPQIIKSLKGANTIWSDTNGNVSLKYWKH